MGAGESKRDSSVSYDVNEESKGVLELPQDLHSGPIHSLAAVDGNHLLSGGADRVCWLAARSGVGGPIVVNIQSISYVQPGLFCSIQTEAV